MKVIEFNSYKGDTQNASSKAKNDVTDILKQLGCKMLYSPSPWKFRRIIQQIFAVLNIKKHTVIVVQYQSHRPFLYRLLFLKRHIKKIAILHDLESLRVNMSREKEVKILNGFNYIISHNSNMTAYLLAIGINTPISNINIFDYLINPNTSIDSGYNRFVIFFAGNLKKSCFLTKLNMLSNLSFNIYGADFEAIGEITKQSNVQYKGSFSPEELISHLSGGWGLVWDGESLESCTGITGEYLKYNNPHKVSMCIVSERPIIIWKESAMAEYIESKGIGLCVNSLFEVYERVNGISEKEYKTILQNVKNEKQRLVSGQNLKDAFFECERFLNINHED